MKKWSKPTLLVVCGVSLTSSIEGGNVSDGFVCGPSPS